MVNYHGNTRLLKKDLILATERRSKLTTTFANLLGKNTPDSELERLKGKIQEANGEIAELEEQRLAAIENGQVELARANVLAGDSGPVRGEVFASFGEQVGAIIEAGRPGGKVDERLYRVQSLAASGGNENIGSEGGFLVEAQFATEIIRKVYDVGQVARLCRPFPIGKNSNGVKLPYVDETSRATGSRWGGIQVFRASEAATVTATKPKFGRLELILQKLFGICYITDELMEDVDQLSVLLQEGFSEELAFTLDDEIINGNGVGQCLGVLNSAALVTVDKESNQTADTVNAANVCKMWARLPARSRKTSAWFVNSDVEGQLFQLSLTFGTGGAPVFLPAGGLSAEPYSTLFNRPIIPLEQCSAIGDLGDIILGDMSQYLLVKKDPKVDTSMHVRFLYDEQTFRVVWRVNGAPLWASSLTPFKGSLARSPFITLQAR